jgi:hypothetical protein
VVVVVGHVPLLQASQQLACVLTHDVPPVGGLHRPASPLMLHRVLPFFVRQHATAPGRPQVDRAAHRRTSLEHSGDSWPPAARESATAAAQRT